LAAQIVIMLGLHSSSTPALAKASISKNATIQADDKVVRAILNAFALAEENLHKKNLDGLMTIYSNDFNYKGISKDDLRKLWADVFARYHRVSSSHIFTEIMVENGKPPTAEVICTGGLWATSNSTGERTRLDSWVEERHRLIFEDGAWRIRGHTGEDLKNTQFGVAHPFF